jgi:hypothetical protein
MALKSDVPGILRQGKELVESRFKPWAPEMPGLSAGELRSDLTCSAGVGFTLPWD